MAKSTLANSRYSQQIFAEVARPLGPQNSPICQLKFAVFATGVSEHPWRVADPTNNQTISRHKILRHALRKCTRLNKCRTEAQVDPLKSALSGFPDVNSHRAYYEGVGNDSE